MIVGESIGHIGESVGGVGGFICVAAQVTYMSSHWSWRVVKEAPCNRRSLTLAGMSDGP